LLRLILAGTLGGNTEFTADGNFCSDTGAIASVSPDETLSDIKVDYTLGIFQAIGRHLLHTLPQADYGVR
jgi:hypothetical protein